MKGYSVRVVQIFSTTRYIQFPQTSIFWRLSHSIASTAPIAHASAVTWTGNLIARRCVVIALRTPDNGIHPRWMSKARISRVGFTLVAGNIAAAKARLDDCYTPM